MSFVHEIQTSSVHVSWADVSAFKVGGVVGGNESLPVG